jgi:hypothetical protein
LENKLKCRRAAKRLGGTILTTDRELAKTREVDSILFSVEDARPIV